MGINRNKVHAKFQGSNGLPRCSTMTGETATDPAFVTCKSCLKAAAAEKAEADAAHAAHRTTLARAGVKTAGLSRAHVDYLVRVLRMEGGAEVQKSAARLRERMKSWALPPVLR